MSYVPDGDSNVSSGEVLASSHSPYASQINIGVIILFCDAYLVSSGSYCPGEEVQNFLCRFNISDMGVMVEGEIWMMVEFSTKQYPTCFSFFQILSRDI